MCWPFSNVSCNTACSLSPLPDTILTRRRAVLARVLALCNSSFGYTKPRPVRDPLSIQRPTARSVLSVALASDFGELRTLLPRMEARGGRRSGVGTVVLKVAICRHQPPRRSKSPLLRLAQKLHLVITPEHHWVHHRRPNHSDPLQIGLEWLVPALMAAIEISNHAQDPFLRPGSLFVGALIG
jgi:hypothetical protein